MLKSKIPETASKLSSKEVHITYLRFFNASNLKGNTDHGLLLVPRELESAFGTVFEAPVANHLHGHRFKVCQP